eukprot:755489-Hanusia_phi.AAC.1
MHNEVVLTWLLLYVQVLHSIPSVHDSDDGLRFHSLEGRTIAVFNEQMLNQTLRTSGGLSSSHEDLSDFLQFVLQEMNPCVDGKHTCDPHATCIPLVKNSAQTDLEYICRCNAGWSGSGFHCENVNECELSRILCSPDMVCKDTPGSFECLCGEGFNKMEAMDICVDVDECLEATHKCDPNADCQNIPGSYVCACSLGYNGDGMSCWGMCEEVAPAQRIDCFQDQDQTPSEKTCKHRGCCWKPSDDTPDTPCYYPLPANFYRVVSWTQSSSGVLAVLDCDGEMRYGDGRGGGGRGPYHIGPYGSEICPLHLSISFESEDQLQIRIFEAFKPPSMIPSYFFPERRGRGKGVQDRKYSVKYTPYPFGLVVQREPDGFVLFNSTPVPGRMNGLSFEPQFVSLSTQVEEGVTFEGLGYRGPSKHIPTPSSSQNGLNKYVVWPESSNQTGLSPFLLSTSRKEGGSFGLLMSNPHAMEVIFARDSLTYRMIGGEIDLRIFVGGSSKDVVESLTEAVGRLEDLPPLWSLGFLVKLNSSTSAQDAAGEARNLMSLLGVHDVPYDGIVTNLREFSDYSENDLYSTKFGRSDRSFARKVWEMSEEIHSRGKKLITAVYPSSLTLEDAIVRDKFKKPVRGKMIGEEVFYLDFFNPNITRTWGERLEKLSKIVEFDGVRTGCERLKPI